MEKALLYKFLPLLFPLAAEVCGGFPFWCCFSVVRMLERGSSRNVKTREANSFGLRAVEQLSCTSAPCSICSWIHPSKCSLKHRHFSLSHTLGLQTWVFFTCFLKKVHGYLSANYEDSSLDPRKTEFHQNLVICLLLQEREEITRVLAGCICTGEPTVPQQRESSAV